MIVNSFRWQNGPQVPFSCLKYVGEKKIYLFKISYQSLIDLASPLLNNFAYESFIELEFILDSSFRLECLFLSYCRFNIQHPGIKW